MTQFVKMHTSGRQTMLRARAHLSCSLRFTSSASLSFACASCSSLNRVVTCSFRASTSWPTCHRERPDTFVGLAHSQEPLPEVTARPPAPRRTAVKRRTRDHARPSVSYEERCPGHAVSSCRAITDQLGGTCDSDLHHNRS